jgi:hypothetical protein
MANPLKSMRPHVLRNRNHGNRQSDQDFRDDNLVPYRQLFHAHAELIWPTNAGIISHDGCQKKSLRRSKSRSYLRIQLTEAQIISGLSRVETAWILDLHLQWCISPSFHLPSQIVRYAIVHGSRGRDARFTDILMAKGVFSAMKNVFGDDITEQSESIFSQRCGAFQYTMVLKSSLLNIL